MMKIGSCAGTNLLSGRVCQETSFMKIAPEDVQRIASLAQLELTSDELAAMQKDLSAILGYIDQLSELDTSSVEAMTRLSEAGQHGDSFRADEPVSSLARDSALQAAPQAAEGFFRVPKVIVR
jgi:aspartyl-tRNA(Asn)/glutamyl-tRNA(Gln) amidotransferase subunit C